MARRMLSPLAAFFGAALMFGCGRAELEIEAPGDGAVVPDAPDAQALDAQEADTSWLMDSSPEHPTPDGGSDAPAAADSTVDAALPPDPDAALDGASDAADDVPPDAPSDGAYEVCQPGDSIVCYSGPPGTLGIGACKSGISACVPDDSNWGPCIGEKTPSVESCNTYVDDDCDGLANEKDSECTCTPNEKYFGCYDGPPPLEDIGACQHGYQICASDGLGLLPTCIGYGIPSAEDCGDGIDADCDGNVDEEGPSCVCTINAFDPCYTGPGGTLGVGICKPGVRACVNWGTAWGQCLDDVTPGAENCASPLDENCDAQTAPPCATLSWAKLLAPQIEPRLARYPGGDLLIAGYASLPSADLGGGPLPQGNGQDIVVARWSAGGNHVWSRRFVAASTDFVWGAAVTSTDEALLVGSCDGLAVFDGVQSNCNGQDALIVKLDPSGKVAWAKAVGDGAAQSAVAVSAADNGAFYVSGVFSGSLALGMPALSSPNDVSVFLAKLDQDGKVIWSRALPVVGGAYWKGDAEVGGLATTTDGGVAIAGRFHAVSMDFGGGPVPSQGLGSPYVTKYAGDGSFSWLFLPGVVGSASAFVTGLSADANGNLHFAGRLWGELQFGTKSVTAVDGSFAAKLGQTGNPLWSRSVAARVTDLAVMSSTRGAVVGYFQMSTDLGHGKQKVVGYPYLDTDAFVLGFDADSGGAAWSRTIGSISYDQATSVIADGSGGLFVAGHVQGVTDFGGVTVKPSQFSSFVARYGP